MRITTRTPPVRLAAADMVAMASLPAEHAGLLLRWGMRRYASGQGVALADARAEAGMDDRGWTTLIQSVAALLDPAALAAGFVVVLPFARAAEHLAAVSVSKVRAARAVEAAAAIASGAAQPARATRPDAAPPATVRDPVAPDTGADADTWAAVTQTLIQRGADAAEVADAVDVWRRRHAVDEVVAQVQAIADRRIAKPVRYLNTVLKNAHGARQAALPGEVRLANPGPILPLPVRRMIKVGPRAGWTFEGWTARGHARGGLEVADRREVWRNDSGTLSYKAPDPDGPRTVPTYQEDPGLYETD